MPEAREPLVRVEALGVRYGDRQALDGLCLDVGAGEILGLLGPNGAGKTTTFSVLATLRRPDQGVAWVCGARVDEAPAAVRRRIGVVPQSLAVYPTLTARENARFFAAALGLSRTAARDAAERALAQVGLTERAGDPVSSFSGGMRRRLNLACGVLHAPPVLLLDEPTVGVDPQSRERIFDTVRAQADGGAAVLYSTHAMDEAERLCDRVVLIDHGRVVAAGTPGDLAREVRRDLVVELATRAPLPSDWLDGLQGAREAVGPSPGAGAVRVQVEDLPSAARVLERATRLGGDVLRFEVHQPGLEELFFARTGRALRD